MWTPAQSYPDPRVEHLDDRFAALVVQHAAIERLHTGMRWAEGPVWFGDHGCLLVSDIPNDRELRLDAATGAVGEFRRGGYTNGNTRDRQGRLVSCEHGTRRVTRTEPDGRITVLADGHAGKRLNSPNDVAVHSDGAVWFSDPTFGIRDHYEGHPAEPELPTDVYRIDPVTGRTQVAISGIAQPNGLAFSPDDSRLYLVQSGGGILAFDMSADGTRASGGRMFAEAGDDGAPDGLRCDVQGNVWAAWGRGAHNFGVRVFAPDGTPLGHIHLPERCANLCFGGLHRTRLFMAASQSLYALYVRVQGAPYF